MAVGVLETVGERLSEGFGIFDLGQFFPGTLLDIEIILFAVDNSCFYRHFRSLPIFASRAAPNHTRLPLTMPKAAGKPAE